MAFPTTNAKSNGNEVATRNTTCGNFSGIITEVQEDNLDRMQNTKKTLCAVIHIQVNGQPGEFNHFIHFNPEKEQASIGKMVADCKAAILSTGQTISNPDEEKGVDWVKESYYKLRDAKMVVVFNQSQDSQGRINLTFNPAPQQNVGF